ncbi:MAG TPA: 50S ribosomal protein L18 [Bacteroidales bacterium]|nr:50S ribosomal protein L18 [Bacteroidales bacterium]HOE04014.1 50S ribosomal protein L18 [Bacteroidales bacterium]HQL69336.1 50S ribosomal protein L18 [Bacteroidales bacterium]
MAFSKQNRRLKIKSRIRKHINGTGTRPRMSVYRSNKQISVQLIDDINGVTLVAATSLSKEIAAQETTKTVQANMVGKLIAKKALEAGISEVVFDRNGYLYHGRVKSLAEGAREGGLKL